MKKNYCNSNLNSASVLSVNDKTGHVTIGIKDIPLLKGELDKLQAADSKITTDIRAQNQKLDIEIARSEAEDISLSNRIQSVETGNTVHEGRVDNPHKVTKAQVGLGNVDNTSDLNKPVSTAVQSKIEEVRAESRDSLTGHTSDLSNPHKVTKTQVGLGNVDNTSDLNKPVSHATSEALDAQSRSLLTSLYLHAETTTNPHSVTKSQVGLGNVDNTSDLEKPVSNKTKNYIITEIRKVEDSFVSHTSDLSNPHKVTKTQVGLGNVDNTSDLDKPISTATDKKITTVIKQQTADRTESQTLLSTKADKSYVDEKLSSISGGLAGSYLTLALAEADKANIPVNSTVNITNDPTPSKNGQYTWDGVKFTKSAFDPLAEAKAYTDTFTKDVTVFSSGSVNNCSNFGYYMLPSTGIFLDLPEDVILEEAGLLVVSPATGGFFKQEFSFLYSTNNVWTRTCRASDGAGIWRSSSNNYKRVYDNIDPKSVKFEGAYVVTNPIGMPDNYSGALFLTVSKFGGFTERTASSTDSGIRWVQQGDLDWFQTPTTKVSLLPEGDLNLQKKYGKYVLNSGKVYTNLPEFFEVSEASILEVSTSAGGFFTQSLYKLYTPNNVWTRTCRVSDGAGVWRESQNRYQAALEGVDPKTIKITGTYVLTDIQSPPVGFVGAGLLVVEKIGGFTIRTLYQTNMVKSWNNVNENGWISNQPTISNSNLTIDYAYRGLETDGDLDTLTSEGNYLVNGTKINAPSWLQDTALLTVSRMGAFIVQRVTSAGSIDFIGQRRGALAGGIWSFSDWSKIGSLSGGGGTTDSTLSGKTIAVIGDSIVEQGDWPERIGERFGSTIHKFGFGGCRAGAYPSNPLGYDKQCMYNIAKNIASGDYTSLIEGAEYTKINHKDDNTPQAIAMSLLDWNSVDILCIAFGTNDWSGTHLGDNLDPDPSGASYKGALAFSIEEILKAFPHLQIVLIGMSFRIRGNGAPVEEDSDNTPNGFGKMLKEFQEGALEVGDKYHIPAYNMYKNSGLNTLTYKQYLRDGVHPIPGKGYQHWANKIGSFLNSKL